MRLRKKHWAIPEMKENPYVYFDAAEYKGKWKEVFENSNKIHIEIGAGKGAFIQELARRNKNINYVIIEQESNAFVYATRKIIEEKLENVRALPINAEKINEYFDKEEIDRIYINFCNPWPKLRHQKRRLTHPRFLVQYREILKKDAEVHFKTDDLDLFNDSLKYFEDNKFKIMECTRNMKLEDYPENIVTEYENKWRSKNIPICYGVFRIEK
ncbi:tRNA (guanosine(46)-N7)-methyltransferase TrmB [Peptoniphilus sp. oral taxon 386]|uniref:tRNA (guanosine(46)-N7)-methyltransferase TrmB n=1 Tax=Peptoniphilus sp. oral taxon 386 TaxID=652713 RepID=UPI0001DAA48B|nr:tRNA (guanosine(46)-N7)-methyltransferase TrmB [Peptoniphilus sp. oral taxon 386]EFI41380.1 tRNA (guanine-N(7)-)-methyltransferase [Peptoniphilus sp. oral taxon 386 str. F0131]